MRRFVHVCGWVFWSLGIVYAGLGIANGEKVVATLRDSTIQRHLFWESGSVRKEEAKVAMFELSDRFAKFGQRVYWTLGGLMAVGTLLIVVGRKRPNQALEPTPTAVTSAAEQPPRRP